jgi:transposase InsO family protein
MGQVLHGSATTTEAVRRVIQYSQESLRSLARRDGINPKTVAKWKRRSSVSDLPTGPKEPRSTVLTVEEEAVVVAFRRHTLLPLDDCLYALQPTIPHLTRSWLHRCLQRHRISRLPQVEGEASPKRKFKAYPIGYFHIDIAEVRTAEGKLYLIVAIDRTSKFAFVELHEKVARRTAGDFLRRLIAAVPYKVRTVLTDNGTHFTTPGNTSSAEPDIKAALDAGELVWAHAFEYACAQNNIDHRLTKPKHPWTNGQVERMNRTIKDATVKRYFYETHDQLRTHLRDFVDAYNFAEGSKPSGASDPLSSSASDGQSSPNDSDLTRSSNCRDQTLSLAVPSMRSPTSRSLWFDPLVARSSRARWAARSRSRFRSRSSAASSARAACSRRCASATRARRSPAGCSSWAIDKLILSSQSFQRGPEASRRSSQFHSPRHFPRPLRVVDRPLLAPRRLQIGDIGLAARLGNHREGDFVDGDHLVTTGRENANEIFARLGHCSTRLPLSAARNPPRADRR